MRKPNNKVIGVLAGISIDLGLIAYVIKEGYFNSQEYSDFLKVLANEIKERSTKHIDWRKFAMDNCSIHQSQYTKENFANPLHKFIFLPRYSSELNIIELFWWLCKRWFIFRLEEYGTMDYSSDQILLKVDSVLKEITLEDVKAIFA